MMHEKDALVLVDVQRDFCQGGALEVREGDQVVPVLNRYLEHCRRAGLPAFATRDWHPEKTRHFKSGGGVWPPHCIQGTRGAEFHPDLALFADVVVVSCGTTPDEDGFSGFEGRDSKGALLEDLLLAKGAERIFVGGLATDYCVKATVLDGLKRGFKVVLIRDAVRGVDLIAGDAERAVDEMLQAGATVTTGLPSSA